MIHAANDVRAIVCAGQKHVAIHAFGGPGASRKHGLSSLYLLEILPLAKLLLPSFVWLAPESRESEQHSWPMGEASCGWEVGLRGVVV